MQQGSALSIQIPVRLNFAEDFLTDLIFHHNRKLDPAPGKHLSSLLKRKRILGFNRDQSEFLKIYLNIDLQKDQEMAVWIVD